MKNFLCALCVAVVGLGGAMHDAEAAKRMGGGKSFGSQRDTNTMQRDATPASPTQNATTAQRQAQLAAPAAAQPAKRSWMGPLAGLAAGIGLAALASHLGFGEEMASFMMIALLVVAALFVWRMFAARRNAPQQQGMQYAGATAGPGSAPQRFEAAAPVAASAAPAAAAAGAGNIPSDFDVDGFLRQAKLNFVRLQAANDKGDVEDIRQFTSPEVFAEIRMQLQERGGETQHIDIVQLDAALLDLATENEQYIASVRFSGLLREEVSAAPSPFDEVWHLAKPVSGERGWVIAGIQQLQ